MKDILQNREGSYHQEISKIFRGKELNKEQYHQFKEGQTVYLTGLVDKKE